MGKSESPWTRVKPLSQTELKRIGESWIAEGDNAKSIPTHHAGEVIDWLIDEIRRLRREAKK